MLSDAEHETLASLVLAPGQTDARNMLGVIYAQEGKTARADPVWRELLRDVSDYALARANLKIIGNRSAVALGETAAVVLPPTAVVRAIGDEREQALPFEIFRVDTPMALPQVLRPQRIALRGSRS